MGVSPIREEGGRVAWRGVGDAGGGGGAWSRGRSHASFTAKRLPRAVLPMLPPLPPLSHFPPTPSRTHTSPGRFERWVRVKSVRTRRERPCHSVEAGVRVASTGGRARRPVSLKKTNNASSIPCIACAWHDARRRHDGALRASGGCAARGRCARRHPRWQKSARGPALPPHLLLEGVRWGAMWPPQKGRQRVRAWQGSTWRAARAGARRGGRERRGGLVSERPLPTGLG